MALKSEMLEVLGESYTENKKAIDKFIDTFKVSVKNPNVHGYGGRPYDLVTFFFCYRI